MRKEVITKANRSTFSFVIFRQYLFFHVIRDPCFITDSLIIVVCDGCTIDDRSMTH